MVLVIAYSISLQTANDWRWSRICCVALLRKRWRECGHSLCLICMDADYDHEKVWGVRNVPIFSDIRYTYM